MNIRQIAFLAGVSVASVSRCINQPEKVSAQTREKINRVIQRADYIPNPSAKSLSTGQTKTIMCVIPTLCNEFFNQIVEGSQKVLGEAGYKLLVYSVNDSDTDAIWQSIDQRSMDGMIISGSGLLRNNRELPSRMQVPYVLIENIERSEHSGQEITYVYSDDCHGINLVLEYLYSEGNRRFGVISTSDEYPVTQRRLSEVHRFFERHPDCVFQLESADYAQLAESYEACRRLMNVAENKPTAIFAFNDMMAMAALRYLFQHGIKVPEQVEVFGFDDSPIASYTTPALSTVLAPNRKLGENAAKLLLEKMRGETKETCVLYPVELKLRETTKNALET